MFLKRFSETISWVSKFKSCNKNGIKIIYNLVSNVNTILNKTDNIIGQLYIMCSDVYLANNMWIHCQLLCRLFCPPLVDQFVRRSKQQINITSEFRSLFVMNRVKHLVLAGETSESCKSQIPSQQRIHLSSSNWAGRTRKNRPTKSYYGPIH